jgi:hypothetical protein
VGKGPSDRNEANEAILHLRRGCECGIVTRPKNVRARLKYRPLEATEHTTVLKCGFESRYALY